MNTRRGFTIVELLIVIVIIAILAAITIVAYNGIQNRARNSAAASTMNTMMKKMHAYNTLSGAYPSVTATVGTVLGTYKESTIANSNIIIETPSAANGTNTLKVELCGSGAGVKLTTWDYAANALSTAVTSIGDTSGSCSVATA